MIEFAIYIPICMLIIISIFFLAIDKTNVIKKQSEMIKYLNEDLDDKSLVIFSKKSEVKESIEVSSLYGVIEENLTVEMSSNVGRAKDILSNIKLLKDILIDIGVDKSLFEEISLSGENK